MSMYGNEGRSYTMYGAEGPLMACARAAGRERGCVVWGGSAASFRSKALRSRRIDPTGRDAERTMHMERVRLTDTRHDAEASDYHRGFRVQRHAQLTHAGPPCACARLGHRLPKSGALFVSAVLWTGSTSLSCCAHLHIGRRGEGRGMIAIMATRSTNSSLESRGKEQGIAGSSNEVPQHHLCAPH